MWPRCLGLDGQTMKDVARTFSRDVTRRLLGKNVHPVTVATFSESLCHFEPKPIVIILGHT